MSVEGVVTLLDHVVDSVWPARTFLSLRPPEGFLKDGITVVPFHSVRLELAAAYICYLTAPKLSVPMSLDRAKGIVMGKVNLF